MKLLLSSFVLALLISVISFGQVALTISEGTLQTGWAVVTPAAGTGQGLSVSEILSEQRGASVIQSSVVASPLVTFTNVVVSSDPTTGLNTGLAIANPNFSTATVTLDFRNQQGITVTTRTITVGSHQQFSRFVTELFVGDPVFALPVTGLMFISSDLPVGVLALALSSTSITALPVATQLNTSVVTVSPPVPTTVVTTAPATTISIPGTPTFNGVPTPPTILPTPSVTPTTVFTPGLTPTTVFTPTLTPITGSPTGLVTSTGVITGGLFGIPTTTSTVTTTTTPAGTPVTSIVFPAVLVGVGGPGSSLLAQVATGGGWGTQIVIANSSAVTQTVRVDFFSPAGAPMPLPFGATVPNIVIAPAGIATIQI